MHSYNDINTSRRANRGEFASGRFRNSSLWNLVGCIVLFGLGQISSALAQDYQPLGVQKTASYYISEEITEIYPNSLTFTSSKVLPTGHSARLVNANGGIFSLVNGEQSYTWSVRTSDSRNMVSSPFRVTAPEKGQVAVTTQTVADFPLDFQYYINGILQFETKVFAVFRREHTAAYLQHPDTVQGFQHQPAYPDLVFTFDPDNLVQWTTPTPVEEDPRAKVIADIILDGGFNLPWAATEDGQIELSIGDYTGQIDVSAGGNYDFFIGVADNWDGTFSIDGRKYDVSSLSSYAQDEFGNYGYFFDESKATEIHSVDRVSGASIEESSNGMVVVNYNNELDGLNLQQRVTYLQSRRSQGSSSTTAINSEGVTSQTFQAPEAVTNEGEWGGEALTSGIDAVIAQGSEIPDSVGEGGEDLVDSALSARDSGSEAINAWRNLKPFDSSSLPRQSSYQVNIDMGEFGSINRSIPLNHPAVQAFRGVALAAFTYLLFASFMKKLTI